MEYKTFWISEKFNEKHCRLFDNESFALRHAEDMFCWGYDVTVIQEDGIILRKSHRTATKKKVVWFIAPLLYSCEKFAMPERFRDYPTKCLQVIPGIDNEFSTFDNAFRVADSAGILDRWEILSHEIEEIFNVYHW